MIRDVTGLNEARDASMPDPKSLVGIQKLAAANSNVATRHILNSSMFLTADIAEALSLRISDILEYSPTADAFVQAIGAHNVGTLKEMTELHLYDFGIFIELEPDEEEKQLLENNIQTALSQQLIDLDDAIDIREVRNIKLANQLLKIKRRKKAERDQKMQQQQAEAQAKAQGEAQQMAAQAEMQKQEQKIQSEIKLEQEKNKSKLEYLKQEVQSKMELMQFEFELNMEMQGLQDKAKRDVESMKEDRKDQRTQMEGKQKSELEVQKQVGRPTKKFESSGNDILGGGIGLDKFNPKIAT